MTWAVMWPLCVTENYDFMTRQIALHVHSLRSGRPSYLRSSIYVRAIRRLSAPVSYGV